ncbi:hypothetical protein A4X03_0g3559 [Tilletia caries]|uniref:O-acetylhomoserine (Thiol)-lyase n=1 Tax=Tilletia caries TaxID=13290 RepID=A0A8T8TK07_9BASI|nr:hypothetical protein A4X03_0g3559 [Tilletia caries]
MASNFDTLQLHAGQEPDPGSNARAVPIFATTSFTFNNSAHGADLFGLRAFGNIYSRLMNPTNDVFEKRIAALEGGVAAVAAASGQSAQALALLSLAGQGDNIVSSSFLYGGSYNQLKVLFPRWGITTKFVKTLDPADFAKAIDEKTKCIYIESIANPKYAVIDIEAIAKVAHDAGIPLVPSVLVATTSAPSTTVLTLLSTPPPSGLAATVPPLLVLSLTPAFTEPSDGYHGLKFWETFGAVTFAIYVRVVLLRDLGPALNPFGAFQLLQGIETLSLRAQRHAENALALAKWLESNPRVSWVSYPGLPSHETHEVAKKYLKRRFGGVLSFGIKGDAAAGSAFVDSLKLASNLANVGDAKTLIIHPASTTHQQLNDEEQVASGVTKDLIRVSVGIEFIDDIKADFEQAFKATEGAKGDVPSGNASAPGLAGAA